MMTDIPSEYLSTAALAIGALGAASYGIVDGLKLFSWIDSAGFERLFAVDGQQGGRRWPFDRKMALDPLIPALTTAYGNNVMELLRVQYRGGRSGGDLPRTLRQGVRIGFGMMEASAIKAVAIDLGITPNIADLVAQAMEQARRYQLDIANEQTALPSEPAMGDEQRSALARLETTIDARIDAALALAETQYIAQTKILAMIVSMLISFVAGWSINMHDNWGWCFIVGLSAVPLAPVAKDLSSALQEAVKALKAK